MDSFLQVSHYLGSEGKVNIDEICRLCRSSRGVMSYIFSCSGVDSSVPLSDRIMDFANIKMSEGDGLPSLICHRCLYHIEKANEFKMICEHSDAVLREYLNCQLIGTKCELSKQLEKRQEQFSPASKDIPRVNDAQFQLPEVKSYVNEDTKGSAIGKHVTRTSDGSDDPQCESEDNELSCPTCNKHFEASDQLSRHILIHTQEGPFPCDFCEIVQKDKASLRAHWKQDHAAPNSHICQTCGEFFSSKSLLLNHNLHHDKRKPHHCKVCQKAFTYRSDLRKHSLIHTGLRPYNCPICFKSFTRSTNLNKHTRLHSGRKPFSCPNCDKMFATRGDLVRHSMIHTGDKPYSCSVCSISFNRKDKLTRHEKLHLGERAHCCPKCPTSFTRKEELTKHMQFHHYSPNMKQNGAEESEEVGKTEDVIISVDPVHWTEEQGTYIQPSLTNLTIQDGVDQKDTNDDRLFGCEICFKRFRHKRELVRHSTIHTGYRPHACPICEKAFARSDKLKRHIETHAKKKKLTSPRDRPQCDLCFKFLSSKHELQRHLMTHSTSKPYQCSLCHCAYCRRDKLIKHIKRSHPDTLHTNTSSYINYSHIQEITQNSFMYF